MRKRSCLAVALAIALPAAAAAQDEAALSDAKRAFEEGQQLFLQGEYARAADSFMRAYSAKPYPAFLYNAAIAFEKGADLPRAIELFSRYLQQNVPARDREEVEKRVATLRRRAESGAVGEALPDAKPRGLVVIESKPQGAAIYIDDKKNGVAGYTPFSLSLEGRHAILLESKGYRPERKEIDPTPDKLTHLFFSLSEEHYLGWIEVVANVPGAEVFIDHREAGAIGKTPYTGFLQPGPHTIWVEREGYEGWTRKVEVEAGRAHKLDAGLRPIGYGYLKVLGQTTKGAGVLLDERDAGCQGYPCRVEMPAGRYTLRLEKDDFKDYQQEVEIKPAHETKVRARLNPAEGKAAGVVALVLGLGFAGTGAYFALQGERERSSLEDDIDDPATLTSSTDARVNNGKLYTIVGDGLIGLGGLIGLLSIYSLLTDEGPESFGEVEAVPLGAPGGGS